jgi:L-iditol 2-dehydrogenase
MKALVRRSGGVGIHTVPYPACTNDDDVRVSVTVAGLCRTDVYVANGRLPVREPLILGHEFTGVVLEVGEAAGLDPGDHVTAIPLLGCGECRGCVEGNTCSKPRFLGVEVDGAFAEQIVLPARNLRKIAPAVDPRKAAYTEPVAAAMAVLKAPLAKSGKGLLLGDNRIATLTERIMRDAGFSSITKMSVALAGNLSEEVDFVIETEANEGSFQVMLERLRPGGVAVFKSRPASPVPLNVALAVKKDVTFYSVSYAPFEDAIGLIEAGAVELDDLLGRTYELDQYEEAFSSADGCNSVKSFFNIATK